MGLMSSKLERAPGSLGGVFFFFAAVVSVIFSILNFFGAKYTYAQCIHGNPKTWETQSRIITGLFVIYFPWVIILVYPYLRSY